MVLVILISAIPAAIAYAKCCANRIRPKIMHIATVLWFIAFIIFFSTAVTSSKKAESGFNEQFPLAIIGALMVGIGFGLWYSLNLAHFMKIIPANKKTEFTGLFSAIGYLPRFAPPLLYAGLVEATNAHTIGFLSLGLWFVIGLGFLVCIDFEKGETDANMYAKTTAGKNNQLDNTIVVAGGPEGSQTGKDKGAQHLEV